MTDEDYGAELRSHGMLSTNQAADRIEQLTAERDVAIKWWGESTELTRQARLQYSDEKARAEAAEAERDRLREALRGLERASTEVASCGARTGPHWLKLTVANLSARAALKGESRD